ncbi:MAG: DUF2637 domain-containing protein [Streptomyces sp.]|uniref:DUF2637 domain-containing protein n=1 Tax=Streptomyces sp. TaxID=1931 RepID=UPI003D6A4238
MQAVQLTRIHRILIAVVVAGAVIIAAIGFAGSYAAVRDLAEQKGFGAFAPFFPIGIDAGIVVLLALDLLLTWIRIPFPLLRQTAWLLTAATIAFNGAAAWPDPLGVGMHAVIPVLFVVSVEAARHAIGRIADITADKHMEGVRISRWLLAFPSTFRLWRRMKLWELRSYDQVIRMEQDRLVYEARLRARFGRGWRRKAPVESLMPLKLARYGVPLTETGPSGLAAAGIRAAAGTVRERPAALEKAVDGSAPQPTAQSMTQSTTRPTPQSTPAPVRAGEQRPEPGPEHLPGPEPVHERAQPVQPAQPVQEAFPEPEAAPEPAPGYAYAAETQAAGPQVTVPVGPGRRRALGNSHAPGSTALFMEPAPDPQPEYEYFEPEPATGHQPEPAPAGYDDADPVGIPDGVPREEFYFLVYRQFVAAQASFPTARQLSRDLHDGHGVTNSDGSLLSENYLRGYMREFKERYNTEMGLAG